MRKRIIYAIVAAGALLPTVFSLGTSATAAAGSSPLSVTIGSTAALASQLVEGIGKPDALAPEFIQDLTTLSKQQSLPLDVVLTRYKGELTFGNLSTELATKFSGIYNLAGYDMTDPNTVWFRFTERPPAAVWDKVRALPYNVRIEWGSTLSEVETAGLVNVIGGAIKAVGVKSMVVEPNPQSGDIDVTANFATDPAESLARARAAVLAVVGLSPSPAINIVASQDLITATFR